MDNLYLSFGESVRRHRKKQRWSQELLAEKAQMGRATIASIEAGRQVVALHQALALCSALSVELGALLGQSALTYEDDLGLSEVLDAHDLEIIRELRHGVSS